MCGISGVFNYLDKKINSKSIITKIIEIQRSRGPDDEGLWESECKKVCFGSKNILNIK